MSDVHRFRMAMAKHLGKAITPEVAAAIEAEAFYQPDASIDPTQFPQTRCGSLTLQAERARDILDELHVLHVEHWKETEKHRHGIAFNPDYEAGLADERAGNLLQCTARCDGALVGNARWYVYRTNRHSQTPFAREDTLYLLPAYRTGRVAVRLIQYSELCLAKLGIQELRADAKLVNGTARLLEHLGYQPVATNFVKFLKGATHEPAA